MRVLVTGGRDYMNADVIGKAMARYASGRHTLVHGDCRGVDRIAASIASVRGWNVEPHPADWRLGRQAGPLRNAEMVDAGADLPIAFPGGRGTRDMVERAAGNGIHVVKVDDPMPLSRAAA